MSTNLPKEKDVFRILKCAIFATLVLVALFVIYIWRECRVEVVSVWRQR